MGLHSRPDVAGDPGNHPAMSLLLSMAAAILVTAVMFGTVGFAHRGSSQAQQTAGTSTARSRPTVELRWTHGKSWVRVTDGKGAVLIDDTYPEGTVKQFTGASFYVEIGNAGAITIIDKGGRPIIAGKPGEPAKRTVTGP